MLYFIVMKYRKGKVPLQIKPSAPPDGPKFLELDPALKAALEASKADLDALVLVETSTGRIEAAFIWGDRILPYLAPK